jgi:hypothetical protein
MRYQQVWHNPCTEMGVRGAFVGGWPSKELEMNDGHDQNPLRGFARRVERVYESREHE